MKRELIAHKDPKSPVSEVFRTLRTNIQFMSASNKLNTLLVTSTFPGEGKSWVTANLAVTFAQAGKRVILVDADMRKGRQYNIFGILPRPGLSNYLSEVDEDDDMDGINCNLEKYIQETEIENLHVITSGNIPPNPSELLVSAKMAELILKLKKVCDIVIIDGTPCDLVTDSVILSRIVDSTVIVTAHKETKKDNLERIVKNIQNVGGKIAGIVVNKIPVPAKKYSESYYYGSFSNDGKKKELNNRKEKIRNTKQDYLDDYDTEKETEKSVKEEYNKLKNVEIETSNDISIDKANEILQQINKYIDAEKLNLNKENK